MPRIQYKERCKLCKSNFVLIATKADSPICYECQKRELEGEIDDPEMKKLFDIPSEFYEKNSFLRSIKINYMRYKNLSEKQVEAFKKVAKQLEEESA